MCDRIVVANVDGHVGERTCGYSGLHTDGRPVVPYEGEAIENPPLLGSYIEESSYGYRGRVYAIHHWCPEDEHWLRGQSDQSVVALKDDLWLSVLVHEGGAVSIPMAKATVVEPFAFAHRYAQLYFGEAR